MAGTPDLFVVCKNCRAEVSPYITECPYCGHRLRKRAPKLEKGAPPRRQRGRGRRSAPGLGRLRAGEIPGIRGEGPPYATIVLVVASAVVTLLARAGILDPLDIALLAGTGGDWWRPITTQFFYPSTAYEVIALGTIFLFGWLLERRHGAWAPLLVAVVGGAAGMGLTLAADNVAFATGGNGPALAMLAAWVVADLQRLRREEDVESDLLGVAAIAIILVLLPAAVEDAHPLAGAGGGLAGLVLGFLLSGRGR
jgi:hypothetical protein